MAQQPAVEWLFEQLVNYISYDDERAFKQHEDLIDIVNKAKAIERNHIAEAIMYALDEDGHTGDWKIKFINDYYERNFRV